MSLDTATRVGVDAMTEVAREFAAGGGEERGAVFTRREVVNFILDLAGYVEAAPLAEARLLEPAAGHGDFLLPAIGRLVRSFVAHGGRLAEASTALAPAILAFEVHEQSLATARVVVEAELVHLGVPRAGAKALAKRWLTCGDFLLAPVRSGFTHIVGNPPYVRQELIPEPLLAEYRIRFRTLYDRADLYVPFFERCLGLLAPSGRLGFICTDRWTKNKYGGPLRALIAEGFELTHFVDLIDTPVFHADVMTYPAITVIQRAQGGRKPQPTRVAYRPLIEAPTLSALAQAMTARRMPAAGGSIEVSGVTNGAEPWLLQAPVQLALVRRLEQAFPTIEEAGCKVGIGVATGNDSVYIRPFSELNVEPSRKLPLARTQDLCDGEIAWKGWGVLNPFEKDGSLVNLDRYPRFARYLKEHSQAIKARHVAKRNPERWFRTIDRIYPELTRTPKLLVPDIKAHAHIVYEPGKLYPHHNLYFITASEWDLRALQAVLLSGIARLFVGAYSTGMRGGFLRFQAQYLRRIRLPYWSTVPQTAREALRNAAIANDIRAANLATSKLYGLSKAEQALIQTTGE